MLQPANSGVIVRPDDPVLVSRLKAKLDEYEAEFEPAHRDLRQQLLIYKKTLLGAVIKKGSTEPQMIANELAATGHFDAEKFWAAVATIRDFCLTGGKNVADDQLPRA
jgi:hypothetical protein